jgi:hypothetical protein
MAEGGGRMMSCFEAFRGRKVGPLDPMTTKAKALVFDVAMDGLAYDFPV